MTCRMMISESENDAHCNVCIQIKGSMGHTENDQLFSNQNSAICYITLILLTFWNKTNRILWLRFVKAICGFETSPSSFQIFTNYTITSMKAVMNMFNIVIYQCYVFNFSKCYMGILLWMFQVKDSFPLYDIYL